MKRYMVFGMDCYYPSGGMNDYIFGFDAKEEFKEELEKYKFDYYHIFDTKSGKVSPTKTPFGIEEWVNGNIE